MDSVLAAAIDRMVWYMWCIVILQIYKVPLGSHAQCASLFMSAVSSQKGCPDSSITRGGRVAVKVGVIDVDRMF